MGKKKKKVTVKGWSALSKYTILRLLANVIDPDEEHDEKEIIAAIAEKFEVEYEEDKYFYARLQNQLVPVWYKNKWIKSHDKVVFEIPLVGSIRVIKTYKSYLYQKDGEDKVYRLIHNARAILEVNGHQVESRPYHEKKLKEIEGEIRTLFEKYEDPDGFDDYFYMIEAVFNKGNNSLDVYRSACRELSQHYINSVEEDEDENPEWAEVMTVQGRFIFDRYMEYLWAQEEDQKPLQYRLGINSFIHKNIQSWLDGDMHFSLKCNLYTDDHKSAVEIFKAREGEGEYLHLFEPFRNLKVWNGWTIKSEDGTEPDDVQR